MLVAERKNLNHVAVLISGESIHLEILENDSGNIFFSCQSTWPVGTICFAATISLFCMFLEDLVDLQTLLSMSPSLFVEIANPVKTALYSRQDIDIHLRHGNKSLSGLRNIASQSPAHGNYY